MRILVTGFAPFGGESVNPSWEAVKQLPEHLGDHEILTCELPVVYGEAAKIAHEKASEASADAIVCVGQAGGRASVTPEVIGINLRNASSPDNAGKTCKEEPIVPGGPDGLFSTLPVFRMADAIKNAGIPCSVSYSAGTYVCNDLLYSLLYHFGDSKIKVCFIHIPFLPEQAKEKFPSLTLAQDVSALMEALKAI